jgi:LuxR family maltose regulon positive regulatory protein
MRSFKRLLLMAEPEGYLRIFINAGAAVLPLLHKALLDDITPGYTARLIGELEQIHPLQPVRPRTAGILIEPLSNREMEVLQLLSQGCSDKKIAEALVIAPETVHKHLKNIYGKLAVHNRTEAVSRALQLALL